MCLCALPCPCRPELALCLLSEVAFLCNKEFRGCLPLLLHACFVLMDAGGWKQGLSQ